MKPNIFTWATSELSQDAFFKWLLEWANIENSQYDNDLHKTAQEFINVLLGKENYDILHVNAGRQLKNIDIWAEINNEYFIVIEDKTNTGEHSEQLERYKEIASDLYKDKNIDIHLIYLKTGNESRTSLDEVSKKGYKIINRKILLNVFNRRQIKNDIFNDFLQHLTSIEDETNMNVMLSDIKNKRRACQGFYLKIQELLDEKSDWDYVHNLTSGFWGFWYHSKTKKDIGNLFILIENTLEVEIKLLIKIDNWDPKLDVLYKILDNLTPIAEKNGLVISKPGRYSPAGTSTVAVVEDAFITDENGNVDIDYFIDILHKLEKTIDEYCE